jgi:glutaminase
MKAPIQDYLEQLHRDVAQITDGAVADYIPELGKANPDDFGICVVTLDGVAYEVGDSRTDFTIQSISKAFIYAAALADRGRDFVATRVGVEPSGDAFNSISLDPVTGAPFNPMINAGAIATSGLVAGGDASTQWQRISEALADFVGHELAVDESVYRSESETGHRNRAIAWMLKNFDIIDGDPMAVLENYFRQCSVLVNCRDLAFMAATLANSGVNPLTGRSAMPAEEGESVLSVMATCGMYDYAGSWLYEVGMPAKSGVGGGIVAVVPGRFGIGVYSPRLDAKGNSVRGIEACRRMSTKLGLHAFARHDHPAMALGRIFSAAEVPSRRQPPLEVRAYLDQQAQRIKYLVLHGFIAVEGAEYVIRRMQEMATDTSSFILDMHQVDGLSESAARLLNQARVGLAEEDVAVVCSRVHRRRGVLTQLTKVEARNDRGFLTFEDNDLAVEWCENRLLSKVRDLAPVSRGLAESLLLRGVPQELLRRIDDISHSRSYIQGEQILRIGQEGDGRVFFIESGHVSILVPLENGAHQRIASLCPGMEFGEMALLGQTTRSASVFADTDVTCRILDVSDLKRLSQQEPQLEIVLLRNLAQGMAARLRGANQCIQALA